MATIPDLVEMALEELAKADRDGSIPNEIKFHQSADAVKPWALIGDYDDHGNFCGSLTMFLVLFPSEYGLIEHGSFKLLDLLHGCGDREAPLRFEAKIHQKSGSGQNNYRTNLLDRAGYFIGSQMGPYTGPGPWAHMGPNPYGPGPMGPKCKWFPRANGPKG